MDRRHPLFPDQPRKHIHQAIREKGPSRKGVARVDGYVHLRLPGLQQRLATGQVIQPGVARFPPGLVALKIKANPVEGHPGNPLEPGIMGKDMKDKAVDSHGQYPVA